MLNRLIVLGLAAVVFSLASPCQALLDPTADVIYHPALAPTAEAALTGQIQATTGVVVGAHSGDADPPAPSDYYADSHTAVFADLGAGASGIFTLDKFDPTRVLGSNGDPIGQLQGLLLYFTVHLKSGRHVVDNENNKVITSALAEIGTSLNVWSVNPTIGVNCLISPSASASGSLAADATPDFPPGPLPKFNLMTQAQIDAYSTGPDRLAAIIDPDDPSSTDSVPNEIYLDTDPAHADMLAAFTGTGTVSFNYTSWLNTYHQVNSQNVPGWTITPKFDVEARVVYLYAAVPEPASMGLLAAAFGPVLLRRLRKRKTRLS